VPVVRKKQKPLTKAELRIMEAVWQLGNATVADVLAASPKPPLAYTTVLTMLRILEQKGYVRHRAEGRAHTYFPIVERHDAAGSAIGDLVQSFFADSKGELALRLLADERPSSDELAKLKEIISRYEEDHR
jgi:predicted transcriptional regulator